MCIRHLKFSYITMKYFGPFFFLNHQYYKQTKYITSKGKQPQSAAYRITPLLHISTINPSYFYPAIIYKFI